MKTNNQKKTVPPVLHLVTTKECARNCKYCCNRQYDLDTQVPTVTKEELETVEEVLLTGGEPVLFSEVNKIAKDLKATYSNIKKVYVYANAAELAYVRKVLHEPIDCIDGFSISIKNSLDKIAFEEYLASDEELANLPSNLVYVFCKLMPKDMSRFKSIERKWQEDFKPAENCIFRKMDGISGEWVMMDHKITLQKNRKGGQINEFVR